MILRVPALQYQLKITRNTRDCIVLHGGLFNMWLRVKLCIPLHLCEHNGSLKMTVEITKRLSMQVGGFHEVRYIQQPLNDSDHM